MAEPHVTAVMRCEFSERTLPRRLLDSRVPMRELRAEDLLLGQGAFGQVLLGSWGERKVAIKRLYRQRISEVELALVKRTAQIHLSLGRHPHIVRMLGIAWNIQSATVLQVAASDTRYLAASSW